MKKILGYSLIIVFGLFFVSRVLNQPKMIQLTKDNMEEGGVLFAIWRYISAELLMPGGWMFDVGMIYLGYWIVTS